MINGVFGLPGAGKSVFLAMCAKYATAGKPLSIGGNPIVTGDYDYVLTNFPCTGCFKLDMEMLGKINCRRALYLIDEISMFADSRNYKNFSDSYRFFFTQHRKFDSDIVYCTQNYDDCDKKIRLLTSKFFYIEPAPIFSRYLSIISPINAFLDVHVQITHGYNLAPPLSRRLLILPKYWNMIDTHCTIADKTLMEYKPEFWE